MRLIFQKLKSIHLIVGHGHPPSWSPVQAELEFDSFFIPKKWFKDIFAVESQVNIQLVDTCPVGHFLEAAL